MFQLHTERLNLIPLTPEQFNLLITNRKEMERSLGVLITDEPLDENFSRVAGYILQNITKNYASYLWFTEWQIVLKEENRIIGGFCFKGEPGEMGDVEIGYGMQKAYRNNGYMTEAIYAACTWAFKQPNVKIIRATTLKNNISSKRVLEKIGMKIYNETGPYLFWKISANDFFHAK